MQCLIDAGRKQHQQMPHPRRQVDPVSIRRVGFNDLRSVSELVEQIRPGLRQLDVIAVRPAR